MKKKPKKKCSAHLHNLSFLKNEETCDFGQGAVAMHVGMFSGCSIHNLCRTPAASNFSAKFFSCVSPFTSNVTYTNTILEINFCFFFRKKGASNKPSDQHKRAYTMASKTDRISNKITTEKKNGTKAAMMRKYIFVCQSISQTQCGNSRPTLRRKREARARRWSWL